MKNNQIRQAEGSFKSEVIHKMTRRASFHDYRKGGTYMFTIFKHPDAPVFSTVSGNPRAYSGADTPRVDLSPIEKSWSPNS